MSDDFESLEPYLQRVVTEAQRAVVLDPAARRRLFGAISAEPAPRRRGRILTWITEPRQFVLPPLATAALAAGLVGIGVLGGFAYNRDGRSPIEQPLAGAAVTQLPDSVVPRAIRFVLVAPQAQRVSLIGDFNGWDPSVNPMTTLGANGTWTVFVPLHPGRHEYSFVVDGTHFVPDPSAPIAPDDGYGHRNSVVLVGGSTL